MLLTHQYKSQCLPWHIDQSLLKATREAGEGAAASSWFENDAAVSSVLQWLETLEFSNRDLVRRGFGKDRLTLLANHEHAQNDFHSAAKHFYDVAMLSLTAMDVCEEYLNVSRSVLCFLSPLDS